MGAIASQITSLTIVYSTVYSDADQRKHQSPRHWPLCGKFNRDRWIPCINGQWRGKCFHLITSSCVLNTILFACGISSYGHICLPHYHYVVIVLFLLNWCIVYGYSEPKGIFKYIMFCHLRLRVVKQWYMFLFLPWCSNGCNCSGLRSALPICPGWHLKQRLSYITGYNGLVAFRFRHLCQFTAGQVLARVTGKEPQSPKNAVGGY